MSISGETASAPSSDARPHSILLTSLAAGAAGGLIAYWTWRMVLKSPIALDPLLGPVSGAPLSQTGGPSWWIPTVVAAALAMMLWPPLAARAARISLIGGSATIVLASIMMFPVVALCTGIGAMTAQGFPPVLDFIAAFPNLLLEAGRVTLVNLLYCGLVTVPVAAFIGLMLAACGRLIAWTVARARPNAVRH